MIHNINKISSIDEDETIYKIIIFLVCHSLDCLFEHLVLYYLSPFHQVIIEIILYFLREKNKTLNDYFLFFGNIIFILIYSEVIILNFCGLGKFTKKKIKDRVEKHVKFIEDLEIPEIDIEQ